jgi:hypothetical protein
VFVPDVIARDLSWSDAGGIVRGGHRSARRIGDRASPRGERWLRPSEAAKADKQKQKCERLAETAHAYSSKKIVPDGIRSLWRIPFWLLRPEYTSGLTNLRSFYFEVAKLDC